MKIQNNYDQLCLAISLKDTKKFEDLISYSDCRKELINKCIKAHGIKNIRNLSLKLQSNALKNEVENICVQCHDKLSKISVLNLMY